MTAGRGVTAIVLAGGRSSRFGRDKLAEPLDGRPLLDHAIDAVRPVATEILVVAAPGAHPPLPLDARLIHDPTAFEGPLVGLLAGLRAAREPRAIVVGGDMPDLVGAVLGALLAALEGPTVAEAVMLEDGGEVRPLPAALRRLPALDALAAAVDGGERRLRAIRDRLTTRILAEADWRRLDPGGASLRDIDTEADLR